MGKVIKVLAVVILVLVGVVLFNTFTLKSKQITNIKPIDQVAVSDSVANHLSQAIQFRTISYSDPSMLDSAQFYKFFDFIEATFPLVHKNLTLEKVNSFALLYKWKGKDDQLKPALLMGHYDVVPVIQGTEKLWEHKPFEGDIVNEYIYGRGALDDKSTVIGILEAVERLLSQGVQPNRDFYLLFGHDEEVSGLQGAKQVAALLESRKISFEYVIDEGGVIKTDGVSGLKKEIALVGIAEKGYVTIKLTSTGEGGHSSMPPPQTSIGILAEGIDKLQKKPFPSDISGASKQLFDYLAPEMSFGTRMAMANMWLFKPIIINSLEKSNTGNALVRTTTAPTILEAGIKDNILPIDAMAKVNFRILPGDSVAGVLSYVQKVINNKNIDVSSMQTSDTDPSAISDTASYGFRLIHTTIKQCFPGVLVSPNLVVGATDSRYFKNLTKNIFRFMPVRINDEDLKRIHGTNERIRVEDLKNVVRFYHQIILGS